MAEEKSTFSLLLKEICAEEKILLESFSGNWAHRLEKSGRTGFIVGYQFGLNPASVQEICRDKALTSLFLQEAGVPAAEHRFLTLGLHYNAEMQEEYLSACRPLLEKNGKLVLKDNYGTGGNRVFLIASEEEAKDVLWRLSGLTYAAALSPYYPIDMEYRVVMLDQEPRLTIRKERSYTVENGKKVYTEWRHNLGQGATGVVETDEALLGELHALARQALSVIPARFASVDIIRTSGKLLVLEINGGVMLEHFSGQDSSCREKAKEVYRRAVLKMLA